MSVKIQGQAIVVVLAGGVVSRGNVLCFVHGTGSKTAQQKVHVRILGVHSAGQACCKGGAGVRVDLEPARRVSAHGEG